MSNNTPSLGKDPSYNGTLRGVLKFILRKFLTTVNDTLPAEVVSITLEGNKQFVSLKPLITTIATGGSEIDPALFSKIPVAVIAAGGFIIRLPVKVGDQGWLKANDRDISLFLKTLKSARPNTYRMHSFSDGMFLPNCFRNYIVATEDKDNLLLEKEDGTVKISLGTAKIKIAAPVVEIDSLGSMVFNAQTFQVTATSIQMNATSVGITAPLTTINGNLLVNGNIHATGTITP